MKPLAMLALLVAACQTPAHRPIAHRGTREVTLHDLRNCPPEILHSEVALRVWISAHGLLWPGAHDAETKGGA